MVACKKVNLPYRVGGAQTTLPIHSDANSGAQMHVSTSLHINKCAVVHISKCANTHFEHCQRAFWHIANVHFGTSQMCILAHRKCAFFADTLLFFALVLCLFALLTLQGVLLLLGKWFGLRWGFVRGRYTTLGGKVLWIATLLVLFATSAGAKSVK